MQPYVCLVVLLFLSQSRADTLRHEYCFCQGHDLEHYRTWGWLQIMDYQSERLNKTYKHDFMCPPNRIKDDIDRGLCDNHDLISGLDGAFCYTDADSTSICMQDWTYAVNGRWMERLPGWYRAGARFKEGYSKNKKHWVLTDCTNDCRRVFPDIVDVEGKCNFTWNKEITTPQLRQDQCRVMEYLALDEP